MTAFVHVLAASGGAGEGRKDGGGLNEQLMEETPVQ